MQLSGLGLHGPLNLNSDQIADNASPAAQITLIMGRTQFPVTLFSVSKLNVRFFYVLTPRAFMVQT